MPIPDLRPASDPRRPCLTGIMPRLLDVLAVATLLGLTALLLSASVDGIPATARAWPSLPEHPLCSSSVSRSASP